MKTSEKVLNHLIQRTSGEGIRMFSGIPSKAYALFTLLREYRAKRNEIRSYESSRQELIQKLDELDRSIAKSSEELNIIQDSTLNEIERVGADELEAWILEEEAQRMISEKEMALTKKLRGSLSK